MDMLNFGFLKKKFNHRHLLKNCYTLIDKNNYSKTLNKIMIDTGIVITIFLLIQN